MSSLERDRALLRRFEPIIRYTRGEQFFPMNVEMYLSACSLWMQRPGEDAICLVPQGELTAETLAQPLNNGSFGTVYFLKFIDPLNLAELATYRLKEGFSKKDPKDVFHAGRGRLARVGYGSRFIDALFSLTLMARGRVPGDTAAAAALEYRHLMEERKEYCYYGRVVRQNGWVTLQYWFFYPFNNWRSGFFGVNDHEADWEMVNIYLYELDNGRYCPEWVAYASHDFQGDDLRRRWDDPELERLGEHPIIYAGAGSHASYYRPGEYLAEIELPFLAPLARISDRVQLVARRALRYALDEEHEVEHGSDFNVFRVPFVDYARGDGIVIGPGQDIEWTQAYLLEPLPDWARHYRGLWGLYARDPIAGEDAPAGPLYNRDGTVRRAWYDPLGWAGLDKLPPPDEALAYVQEQIAQVEARRAELETKIEIKSRELAGMGIESKAMQRQPYLKKAFARHQEQLTALSQEVAALRAQLAADEGLLEALQQYRIQLAQGHRGPPRAHLRRAHEPFSDAGLRFSRFAETWAAVSIGLMLISFVVLFLVARQYLIFGLVSLLSLLIFIEAGFRRRLSQLVTSVTIGLAIVASFVLLFEFFWEVVVIGVLVAGSYIMWENLRELWT